MNRFKIIWNLSSFNFSFDHSSSVTSSNINLRKLTPNTRREQRMECYANIAHLAEDFVYTVKTYGRIIISEGLFQYLSIQIISCC